VRDKTDKKENYWDKLENQKKIAGRGLGKAHIPPPQCVNSNLNP